MNPLCISNIAWGPWDDPAVFKALHDGGVVAQEIAPGKVFGDILSVSDSDVSAKARQLCDAGFSIPAFQAILFGHPEFQVFNPESHEKFLSYLGKLAHVAAVAGAKVLVFGAPKNRRRYGLPLEKAYEMATDFFAKAGTVVAAEGACLGLEANPAEYTCDFLTCTRDVISFVQKLNSKGVGVHLDTGAMTMNHEDIASTITAGSLLIHYHISEPMLANIADGTTDHVTAFRALHEIGYNGIVSVEMKQGPNGVPDIVRALEKIRRCQHAAEA